MTVAHRPGRMSSFPLFDVMLADVCADLRCLPLQFLLQVSSLSIRLNNIEIRRHTPIRNIIFSHLAPKCFLSINS